MTKTVPIVAIVGQANVGKSSLLNAAIGRREAVVAKEAGTTRDRLSVKAGYGSQDFWLVDTAGLKDAADNFELTIQDQIAEAAKAADLIWVVVEAGGAISEGDRRVAKLALKTKKPVFLITNKVDQAGRAELTRWQGLGIKPILPTSATQRRGIDELLKATASRLPPARITEAPDRLRVAILGRPNVGKSALFNSMLKKQQAIVSERAGTTRDVNRSVIRYHQRELEILDTAGIRRSGKIERGVEHFSVLRSLAAIEEADVCILIMEHSEPSVQLDQKIASLVKEAGKGLILAVSKWDTAETNPAYRKNLTDQIASDFAFTPWAPLVLVSARTGQNVAKLFDLVLQIDEARHQRVRTTELNRWLQTATYEHPPAGRAGDHPKLNYIVQEEGLTPPSFQIFGKHTKALHWSYKRYLERHFRQRWPYDAVPLKFWFIDKQ
jgi:GTP-binding protein